MKAELLPLQGKYYGSIITISDDNYKADIQIWCNADFKPSDRELEQSNITRSQYERNDIVMIDEKYGEIRARDILEISDSHFESQWTYELANKIVNFINIDGYCGLGGRP